MIVKMVHLAEQKQYIHANHSSTKAVLHVLASCSCVFALVTLKVLLLKMNSIFSVIIIIMSFSRRRMHSTQLQYKQV